MLRELTVENLAIIQSAAVDFREGMNAITGETGAGKSVLVGAIELALGGRASSDLVRSGAKTAAVEAVFEEPLPPAIRRLIERELELEWEPGEPLALRREISATGRSRCFIAGQMVNVADLKRLGEALLDLHGQHEHQSLFHRSAQRSALDAYGGHHKLLEKYRQCFDAWRLLERRKRELEQGADEAAKRLDYLNYQIEELEALSPAAGEMEELTAEESRLANAETLAGEAARAVALLYEGAGEEGASVTAALAEVWRAAERIGEMDATMSGLAERLAELEALAEDIAAELRSYRDKCEADPARLEQVIERIEALRAAMRKHGAADEAALLETLTRLRAERDGIGREDEERGEIEAQLKAAREELEAAAGELTKAREKAAAKMAKEVAKTLARVGMAKAKFEIAVSDAGEFAAEGRDAVEFLLAANVGEGRHPLREVASGGELSRTMLAIKTALAARDGVPTLVFDEIDAGISGETAARVGELMADLGRVYQIICITHHASIAARAGHHLSISKAERGGRTQMTAVALGRKDRVEELARMMGGDGASAAGQKLAEQLLGA